MCLIASIFICVFVVLQTVTVSISLITKAIHVSYVENPRSALNAIINSVLLYVVTVSHLTLCFLIFLKIV